MTPPALNITEETYVIDSSDSLSISCRYSALTQGGLGPESLLPSRLRRLQKVELMVAKDSEGSTPTPRQRGLQA